MPTEPVVEPRPPTGSGIDTQMVDLFFDRVPFGLAVGGFGYAILRQRTDAVWLLAGLHALSDLLLPTTGLHGAPCGWCSSATTSHSWSGAS